MYVEDHNERFPTLNNYQANPNYGSGSPDTANKLFYDLMDDTQVLLPYTGYETQRELVDSGTLLCPSDDVPASSPGEDRLSYVVTEYDTNKKGDAIEFGLISQLHINKNVTFESVSLMYVEQLSGTIMWGERWYGTVIVDDTITYNAIPKFDANPVKNVNKLTLGSIQDPELGYLCHPETGGPTFLMVDMSLKRMIYQEVIKGRLFVSLHPRIVYERCFSRLGTIVTEVEHDGIILEALLNQELIKSAKVVIDIFNHAVVCLILWAQAEGLALLIFQRLVIAISIGIHRGDIGTVGSGSGEI
jgi:hypothetical protein